MLAIAIAGIWLVSAYINVAHAFQLAGTSYWAWSFAGASLAADVFKVGSAVGMAAALIARPRYWGAFVACLLIWAVTMGWSVRSNIGFATTMITETRDVSNASRETSAAIKASAHDELKQVIQQQQWMRQQTTTKATGANAEERRDVRDLQGAQLEEAKRLEKRADELRQILMSNATTASAVNVHGDAIGRFFREQAGISQATIDLFTALGFLLVIELPATFALVAFAPLFAPIAAASINPAGPPAELMVGKSYLTADNGRKSAISPSGPPQLIEAPLARVQAARDRISAGAGKRAQAETFLKDLRVVHGTGAVIDGDVVRSAYPEWARREGIDDRLTPWALAQQLLACGVTKEARGVYRLP